MKKFLCFLAVITCAPITASAAERGATNIWSGFYVGATAGYAWGQSRSNTTSDCPGTGAVRLGYYCDGSAPALIGNAVAVAAAGSGSTNPAGFTGGGLAGYNSQRGDWVFGFETDLSSFKLNSARSSRGLYPVAGAGTSFVLNSSIDSSWLWTARARAGWTVSNALIYATGGLAISELTAANFFLDNASTVVGANGSGSGSAREVKVGYSIGGGAEWSLTRNWSIKAEYLFVDLGEVQAVARVTNPNFAGGTPANLVTTSTDLTAHIARFGANYRF
ncbi:MAG: porin family protein [Afipia sp.]|nr:porin family protein [Afipia sp.]